jgi:general secretion pathway protein F
MPLFSYKAVNSQGEVEQGVANAGDEQAMLAQLQQKGWIPIEVNPAGSKRFLGIKISESYERLSDKEILLFADELQTLLQAGLPLDKALRVLSDLTEENSKLSRIIMQILQAVKAGSSLADALEQQSGIFSRFFLNMIRAGETGGNLADVLKRLAVYLESSQDLKNTVTTAMIYPVILLVMSLASLFVMLTFVVPQFSEMFASAGKALPLPTQIVVALAGFLQQWWWLLLLMGMIVVIFFKRQLANTETAKIWHERLLSMPLLGRVILNKEIAALCRTLGTLLGNGVSLLNALAIARETVTNLAITEGLQHSLECLREGESLSQALSGMNYVPPLALQMIRMGEETGRLEEMLLRLADIYDKQLRTAIQRMLALLEPALIITLGLMIAGIIVSILLAILSVNDLVF